MLYQKTTNKSLDQIDRDLREAAARNKFGVLAMLDLKQTMKNKGVEFGSEVRVYEVCNPFHARTVLGESAAVSTALPCRISVYESAAGTQVATILPSELMRLFASTPAMEETAAEVERTLKTMIDETV